MKAGTFALSLVLATEASWAVVNGLVAFELSGALGMGLVVLAILLGAASWLNARGLPGRRAAGWLQIPVIVIGLASCVLEPSKPWLGLPYIAVGSVVFGWALFGLRAEHRKFP